MRKYQEANLGGLEITPIYGIHGYEDRFKDFLSPESVSYTHLDVYKRQKW